ncbi:hypothetical protein PsYK624_107910 [Phanerochaete sordida]|uniref:Galactose oxidase n=1 Tax=Phanerochaete sordida TaxID=48140 RepID=A0A9P3GJ96_9APHY|nr:hypothetical protein PsYK624_107910 [Phanerochaete sordida]
MLSLALVILGFLNDLAAGQSQYAAIPRWGQAVALVQDTLYIHGGRTDPYNSFSYTSAPPNNDLLSLSLTLSFDPSSPPLQYVSGCSSCASSQGPAVAWHTLTPYNTSGLLLFGGDPGPNSPVVLPDRNDSSVLLGVPSSANATWDYETESWADEPMRRIYHAAVEALGLVWIIGGQKADGSGSAFSDHYVFNPNGPSFTLLPSANGPPDIAGHQAVVLNDGRLLVFGGYSPSEKSLIPFDTIWSLDLTRTSDLSWSTLSVSSASVPPPRRNFAATVLDSGRVLIHGGSDAVIQNSLSDGWVLDTTQSPMVWSNVSALTQLGPRRDHFAVGLGAIAIFGFGYAQNGAASAAFEVFDLASGTFQTSYTPPAAVTSPTATTLPVPGQTGTRGTTLPATADWPAPSGTSPAHGGGNGTGNPNGNGDGDGGSPQPGGASAKNHATTVALATAFSVLALLVGAAAATWYIRRRRSQESFHLLDGSGDEDSPHDYGPIPIAGMAGSREKSLPLVPVVRTVKDRLSRVVPGLATTQEQHERRDMLADEDREFEDNGWYGVRRHPSSERNSLASRRRPTLERVYDSLASLRTVSGAVIGYAAEAAAAGARSLKSREPSTASRAATLDDAIWDEKRSPFDPYRDDYGVSEYPAPSIAASRPRGGRQGSSYTYVDPFDDYDLESLKYDPDAVYRDDEDDEVRGYPSLRDPPPAPKLQSMRPLATLDLTRLTPVTERSSLPTLTDPATSSESSLTAPMPRSPGLLSSNGNSSSSSHEPHSPRRPSSIIDANPSQSQFVKRSNSWWARFAKTPLLDRRGSSASRTPRPFEFRDPNPPPRLLPIEESTHSQTSPDSPEGPHRGSSGHEKRFSTHHHGRSASSLQTARTADSAALERMAASYQIVQKQASGSSRGSAGAPSREASTSTTASASAEGAASEFGRAQSPLPLVLESSAEALVHSPVDIARAEAAPVPMPVLSPPPSPRRTPPSPPQRRSPGAVVSERVQAYERRMSLQEPPGLPPPVPARTRITSTYGLAPKPSLFVANPDHRQGSSGDS